MAATKDLFDATVVDHWHVFDGQRLVTFAQVSHNAVEIRPPLDVILIQHSDAHALVQIVRVAAILVTASLPSDLHPVLPYLLCQGLLL